MPVEIKWEKIDRPLNEKDFENDGTVLLESQLRDPDNRRSFLLYDPQQTITCHDPEDVKDCLRTLDEKLGAGYAVAGFISYEAGLALTPNQKPQRIEGFPLINLGIYDRISYTDAPLLIERVSPYIPLIDGEEIILDTSHDDFFKAVETIRDLIAEGHVYQVNYTVRMLARALCPAFTIYRHIRHSHPVSYGGFIRFGSSSLITQSPELFLRKKGEVIETRPMKGTMARGGLPETDSEAAGSLSTSEKDRAENLMIADLMRNDLGRISVPGSVEVFDAFRVEPLNTLFQMTTGVRAQVQPGVTAGEVLEATFPPGSVTGAPKVRAMQIISELEKNPRKAYTGAVGIFLPDGDLTLNVAIRTILADDDGSLELGIGSGIVYDSSPEGEYEETLLKSAFLRPGGDEFCILETILLEPDSGFTYLADHLDRMDNSSKALGFPFSREKANLALELFLEDKLPEPAIVRLRLNRRGEFGLDISPLLPLSDGGPFTVGLSSLRVDPADKLLYHKTTSRKLYDSEFIRGKERGFNETLLINTKGHITEGTFTNLFINDGSGWITPDVSCGLLPGIWRGKYMQETGACQGHLDLEDLKAAESVVIGNSVRGSIEVDEVLGEDGAVLFRSSC